MKINELTIIEASEKLKQQEISSLELTKACLARIKEVDEKTRACITVCEKEALAEAEQADLRRKNGEDNILLGIPFIAKDNILTKNIKTTASSKVLENYIAPYDATIIKKLKSEGAILLAKANLDEFAHGASTENSAFGPSRNPWDLERVPGGSSGGSAAAVAAHMCIFALGTDTGGSIRCPASFCGVTGLKPTYGRSSRFGLIAMTSSTDVPGPITKTVEDAAVVLRAIAGRDKNDATTLNNKVPDYQESINNDIEGLKIGLPREYFSKELKLDKKVADVISKAIDEYKKQGVEFVEVNLPHTKYGIAVYYLITPAEISSNLARFDGIRYGYQDNKKSGGLIDLYKINRGKSFGPEAKRRIMLGTYVLSAGYYDAYYKKAQKVRTIIKQEIDRVLEAVDCLLTPTSPHVAFKIGEQSDDPLQMYLEDVYVTGASLAGLPAMSVPAGFADNLPVGFQLIGKRFDEAKIFNIGNRFQSITNHHKKFS